MTGGTHDEYPRTRARGLHHRVVDRIRVLVAGGSTMSEWPLTSEQVLANALLGGNAWIVDGEPARGGEKRLVVVLREASLPRPLHRLTLVHGDGVVVRVNDGRAQALRVGDTVTLHETVVP